MDEVETFANAGETAGAAVGTGVQTARKGATRARRRLAARIEPAPPPPRRGRRWPWLLLLASLGSAVAAVVLARRPQPIDRLGELRSNPPRPHHPHGNGFVGA